MGNDPIDSIMSGLIGKGAVDPRESQARQARLKDERGRLGAAPATQGQALPPSAPPGQPQQPIPGMPEAPGGEEVDARQVYLDQLNESIISLKIIISQTEDPEERKVWEDEARDARKKIRAHGGTPIEAQDTIEDGLQKLLGHGFVGGARLDTILNQGVTSGTTRRQIPTSGQPESGPQYLQQPDSLPLPTTKTPGIQAQLPDRAQQQQQQRPGFDQYVPDSGLSDQLSAALRGIGAVKAAPSFQAPTPQVDADYVNQLYQQWGIQPKTQEEIDAEARAFADRVALGKTQVIQRELDRFNDSFPDEFEKSKALINEYASELSAEHQEEFAARGMYYTSVMSGALQNIDDKALQEIGSIARDAALYVNDLERQMQDVAEMAVLEYEVERHRLMTEDQGLRQQLANVQLEVAMRHDQHLLDRWYKESQVALQSRAQAIQEAQMRIQQADALNQDMAAAWMVNDPGVQESLKMMGITNDQLQAMDPREVATLVRSALQMSAMGSEREMQNLQATGMALDNDIKQKYATHGMGTEHMVPQVTGAIQNLRAMASEKKPDIDVASGLYRDAMMYLNSMPESPIKNDLRSELNSLSSQLGLSGQAGGAPSSGTSVWGHIGGFLGGELARSPAGAAWHTVGAMKEEPKDFWDELSGRLGLFQQRPDQR